ncbi:MerR family transcriptional regulator [Terrabacter sp. GCM10028922]|uniref:MerR family transcriptional regulator n=1 Tax=Terrabacter sp. GCM10028922 TaxID=3273428 RepID=UPI003614C67B
MARPDTRSTTDDPDRALYGITVAAELVGMRVQNLRLYEARGLLEPHRTAGGTRRYSGNDLERLRRIGQLLDEGLNLAGIDKVLGLESRVEHLETQAARRRGTR